MDFSKLSKDQLADLKTVFEAVGKFPYIARDKDGTLAAYEKEPIKTYSSDEWFAIEGSYFTEMNKDLFPDVAWTDAKPINIENIIWFLENAVTRFENAKSAFKNPRKFAEFIVDLPGSSSYGYYNLPNTKQTTREKELAIKANEAYLNELIVPDDVMETSPIKEAEKTATVAPALPAARDEAYAEYYD